MNPEFKDKTCIVGVGHTAYGALPGRSPWDLAAEAFQNALDDSGLTRDDIDGLIVSRAPSYLRMADMLGIRHPRLINYLEGGGRQSGLALQYAASIVNAGLAHTVACVYGNNGRSAGARYGGGEAQGMAIYDAPYGMTSPGAACALMFRRHQLLYGTKQEHLGYVTMNNRLNASLNPNAVMKKPFTLDEYMNARFIAEPLRLLDYCIINDGGVAFIVQAADRARDNKKPPVYITATGACASMTNFYQQEDMYYTALQDIAKRIYPAAGITPKDVDCAQIYDNFTPTVLFSLEGMGFCPRGESGPWLDEGRRIARDGELPLNTSGSHTSESYMQGWALHVEAVRQLRGEGGPRQVKNCEIVQYVCCAPIASSHILTRR